MRVIIATVVLASSLGVAHATPIPAGFYLCEIEERTGIGQTHPEADPGPAAFIDDTPRYRFRIEVRTEDEMQRVVEAPYNGPERSMAEWQTPNSTLHEPYFGADGVFRAREDMGFLNLGPGRNGRYWLYHSAFEYPGGADVVLSVRYGQCERE